MVNEFNEFNSNPGTAVEKKTRVNSSKSITVE